jgi:V8-like Glu-specific endopeptidase
MRVETVGQQLLFVTARVVAHADEREWVGTAFVYAVETDKGTAHFLVSNRHVFQDAKGLTVSFVRGNADGKPIFGQFSAVNFEPFDPAWWRGHPDTSIDVAVLPLSNALNSLGEAGMPAFFRNLSEEHSVTRAEIEELDAIEDVVFVGYPSGIYDSTNYTPVVRRGTTATPVALDYEGKPIFLIDASVFPGSSGSPVFLYDPGPFIVQGSQLTPGSRFKLLGVLAANATRHIEGKLVELPTRLGVVTEEALDLGIVYKAWTIDECLTPLLDEAGLTRVGQPPASTTSEPTEADEAVAAVASSAGDPHSVKGLVR